MSASASQLKARTNHPAGLEAVFGRIRDFDSHEHTPAILWRETFGESTGYLADIFSKADPKDKNTFAIPIEHDDAAITESGLGPHWMTGSRAPGAIDMRRRLDAMDAEGISEAFIFPGGAGGTAVILATSSLEAVGKIWKSGPLNKAGDAESSINPRAYAREVLRSYNDWCIRVGRLSRRLRPVAPVLTTTLREALVEAERVIAGGVRAVTIPTAHPIEGKSPSHPDNDVLWRMFADNNVAVMFHIGGEFGYATDGPDWVNTPTFASAPDTPPKEVSLDPLTLSTVHFASQNYLSSMVLGGTFERVPNLRIGVAEVSGHWIGPMAETLDLWAAQFSSRLKGTLAMQPSEYVRRNVRCSPYLFEGVDAYIERFPFLEDVYCFATDYPHFEGGKDPHVEMAAKLARLGSEVTEKFFVTNAAWVMPD